MVSCKIFSFGKRIRLLREERNLSLREVSINLGIDISLLGKIERNKRYPTKEQIKLISSFYKLDERNLVIENLSDQIANLILEADVSLEVLEIVEKKINYLLNEKSPIV